MMDAELDRFNLKDYHVHASFSRVLTTGGGVMVLGKENMKCKTVKLQCIQNIISEKEFECCVVEYKLVDFHFVLVAIYRSPSSNMSIFFEKLSFAMRVLVKKFKNIMVVGDININVLDSYERQKLNDVLKLYNMRFLVNFPTRITCNTESALDNVLTNFDDYSIKVEGINSQISDHDGLMVIVDAYYRPTLKCCNKVNRNVVIQENKFVSKESRVFNDGNLALFVKFLDKENWCNVYNANVDKKFDVFHETFMYYFNLCFPKVKKRLRNCKKVG